MHTIKRILVVSRMTQYCAGAVHYGIAMSRQLGAKLYIMQVMKNPLNSGKGWNLSAPTLTRANGYDKMLQKTMGDLETVINSERSNGNHIIKLIRTGDAGEVIMHFAYEKDIDLIIMSAHEEGRMEHFLFNYSKKKIIRRMPCSILLVKTKPAVLGAEY